MELLPQQRSAIDKLRQYRVGALFMEPGTGKTRTALELIRSIVERDNVLWITPFGTKANLRAEIDKHGGLENLTIVGVETLSSSRRVFLEQEELLSNSKCAVMVVDESLKIKNYDAIRTQRVMVLGKLAQYRLILNGTPITKGLLDLWPQFQFLSPQILNMNYRAFKNKFCVYDTYIDMMKGGKRKKKMERITGYSNIDYLYSLIGHYVYECRLELNKETKHIYLNYELSEEEREQYNKIKSYFLDLERLLNGETSFFLSMMQRLQQSYCISEGKFNILDRLIKRHGEDRIIVFTKFVRSREAIQKRNPKLMVLSYGKHAYGLNLQRYNVTIYFDKTFDYAQVLQSEYRTFRTGQQSNCLYYLLTGNVGAEKIMDFSINRKQSLLEYIRKMGLEQAIKEL